MTDPYIIELCEDTIHEWKEEKVAETRAIRRLEEMVQTDNVAVAVGPPGCGKSTAIHFVALQLAREQDYEIIILHDIKDISNLDYSHNKRVFVLENVFGIDTFDENKAKQWLEMSNNIKKILSGNQLKVLASSQTHIFHHRIAKTINILSDCSCDFVSSEYCLTDDERVNIASIYLTKDEIRDLKSSNALSTFYFFPKICRYYFNLNAKVGNVVDVFTNPVEVVSKDLNKLFESCDQTSFATLFLFVVYNNYIIEREFIEKCKISRILEIISDNFILKCKFSIKVVKNEMEKLINSYIKKA